MQMYALKWWKLLIITYYCKMYAEMLKLDLVLLIDLL